MEEIVLSKQLPHYVHIGYEVCTVCSTYIELYVNYDLIAFNTLFHFILSLPLDITNFRALSVPPFKVY
jgi:hypothetical protein